MLLVNFQKELEEALKKSVKFTINDNRSTLLSVRWEPNCTKVSIHRLFEKAPKNVMDSLACYIRREEESISLNVKNFIESQVRHLDYTSELQKVQLIQRGSVYDLNQIFDEINQEYFEGKLELNITWYQPKKKKKCSQVTFGLYQGSLKLIKINKFLDNPSVPKYLISFVIYHEMLHHVCPAYYDENGKLRIHNKEFKRREADYKDYDLAQKWIERYRENFEIGRF